MRCINNSTIIQLIFLIVVIGGCRQATTPSHYSKIVDLGNGELLKQIYTKDGDLISELQMEKTNKGDTIVNGYEKIYYPNGTLKRLSFKSDTLPYGNWYTFYENKALKSIGRTGKVHDSVTLSENGLKSDAQKLFVIHHRDTFKVNKQVPIMLQLELFEGTIATTEVKVFDENNQPLLDTSVAKRAEHFSEQNLFYIPQTIGRPGKYIYSVTITYVDSATNTILLSDSAVINLRVIR